MQCDHKATEKRHLQTHIKSVHEGQKFQCPQFEYKATEKGNLQKHIKSVHEGQTFACTLAHCDYQTKWKNTLVKHKKKKHTKITREEYFEVLKHEVEND